MTERVRKLLAEIVELSQEEQDELFSELVARLDGPPDPDVEQAWAKEIMRRLERVKSGESKGTDWEIVHERLRRRLDEMRTGGMDRDRSGD